MTSITVLTPDWFTHNPTPGGGTPADISTDLTAVYTAAKA